jgi:GNAT superfamily N-acetyltransferase
MRLKTPQHTQEPARQAEAPAVALGVQKAAHALPDAFRAQAQAPLASELAEVFPVASGSPAVKSAAVFDGKKVVASYDFGNVLLVAPGYRGQGIATELVYQWRTRFPGPGRAPSRTPASQHIQEKVWDRIMREQNEN